MTIREQLRRKKRIWLGVASVSVALVVIPLLVTSQTIIGWRQWTVLAGFCGIAISGLALMWSIRCPRCSNQIEWSLPLQPIRASSKLTTVHAVG